MKKKVKFLYIDKHSITRNFFEHCLKETNINLITLEDFSTLDFNIQDFEPDLILCDSLTLLNIDVREPFDSAFKKAPDKFVLCGKIEEIKELKLNGVKTFLKPYSPHELAMQLMTFLPGQISKKDQAH